MDEQQKRQLESEICAVVQGMQGWVPLAEIGGALGSAGISYRT